MMHVQLPVGARVGGRMSERAARRPRVELGALVWRARALTPEPARVGRLLR